MVDPAPLVRAGDRFPIGLPGHVVPLSSDHPTARRPWGMDHAIIPPPMPLMGKHEKPTSTKTQQKATTYTNDSKQLPDPDTITVTD
jgi:hypothetical protein